jgi:hypothetical protein
MDIKTLLRTLKPAEREAFAVSADTTVAYLYLLAGGHRRASPAMAKRLVEADARLTLPELRPDIWTEGVAA